MTFNLLYQFIDEAINKGVVRKSCQTRAEQLMGYLSDPTYDIPISRRILTRAGFKGGLITTPEELARAYKEHLFDIDNGIYEELEGFGQRTFDDVRKALEIKQYL